MFYVKCALNDFNDIVKANKISEIRDSHRRLEVANALNLLDARLEAPVHFAQQYSHLNLNPHTNDPTLVSNLSYDPTSTLDDVPDLPLHPGGQQSNPGSPMNSSNNESIVRNNNEEMKEESERERNKV